MRIQDPNFPAEVHPAIQDGFADVIGVINNGTYEFPETAGVPVNVPEGSTAIKFAADATTGAHAMFVWSASLGVWVRYLPA